MENNEKPLITSKDITLDYLNARPLSYSSLKSFRKSPKHYLEYLNGVYVPSDAQKLGSLVDVLLLSPELFPKLYMVVESKPEQRSNAGKEQWRMILEQASANKKMICFQSDYEIAKRCVQSVYDYEISRVLIENRKKVQSELRWIDKETGLPVIGKIDCESRAWGSDFIIDLKTAADGDPDVFNRKAYDYDYHLQTGVYLEGYHKVKYQFPNFIFLVVETSEPFNVSVNFCENKFVEQAKSEFRGTLMAFKYCLDKQLFDTGYEFRLFGTRPYFSMRLPGYYKPRFEGYEI